MYQTAWGITDCEVRVQIVLATGTKTPSQAPCPAVHPKCLFHPISSEYCPDAKPFHPTSSECRPGGKAAFFPHAHIHSTACVLRPVSWLASTGSPFGSPASTVLAGTPLTTTPARSRHLPGPSELPALFTQPAYPVHLSRPCLVALISTRLLERLCSLRPLCSNACVC